MDGRTRADGIKAARLKPSDYTRNFADLHPPLSRHEALVEADRCYFCFDAPCQTACPTSIDIPLFIREIASGDDTGAAMTILQSNILGGMCARVCPTETLCEEACVREHADGRPVKIGLLQRQAVDALMATGSQPFKRGKATGRRIAIVGGGPAGLACAHKLAELGHAATIFEARAKLGGLNEYGIAAYKTVDEFAQREVDFVLAVGGIEVKLNQRLGGEIDLGALRKKFDAVFVGTGLSGVNALGLKRADKLKGVLDAVDYIARLRQAKDLAKLPVGRRVVIIGGGMTAIDAAVQSKRLGAEEVTIVYRRGMGEMKASRYEQRLAQTNGVLIRHWAMPKTLHGKNGHLTDVTFEETKLARGKLQGSGRTFALPADVLFSAIGQTLVADEYGGADVLRLKGGRIIVDAARQTSLPGVWAGGDCVAGGKDLTVSAVEDGKQAAIAIDAALKSAKAA